MKTPSPTSRLFQSNGGAWEKDEHKIIYINKGENKTIKKAI